MNNRKIFDFLRDLNENNSKEWMDENRDRYHEAKEIWIEQCAAILDRLAKIDPKYGKMEPKKTIMRINNNRMFHPDRPVYKDNFAFSPSDMSEPALYVHVSPSGSFIGGGLHHPDNKVLKKIRAAIDYDGDKLLKIINQNRFQEIYGGLSEDEDKLKTSPRGYSEDHKHIELLRRKNFTAIRSVTQKEVNGSDFTGIVEESFKVIQPFNAYLKKAIDFEA